jgi:predicted alpha-1,2-mannosidase
MRGKYADGSWVEPFNPYYSNHSVSVYVEGNAWQYTWLAPQDLDGLVQLYGSREKTVERLDSLFAASSRIDGEHASSDMTGLVGQYVHGNEPSHHIIYFYTMLGQPWKTADLVRQVLTTLYDATPSGIAGNEDAGQMSAWYVLSAMGLYQVEPAGARYWFGSPILDKAEIAVPGGRFTIIAKDNSPSNKYIKKVTLNGKPYDKWFIDYSDIVKGGELVFEMCDKQCEL